MTNFINSINIKTNINPPVGTASASKVSLLFGHRSNSYTTSGNNVLQGHFYPANPGYPQVDPYHPLYLGSFPNGDSALSYMSNLGFQVNYSISFNYALGVPAITPGTVNPVTNVQTVLFALSPNAMTSLLSLTFSGSLVDSVNNVTGNVISAYIDYSTGSPLFGVTCVVNPTTGFLATSNVTLSAINQNGLPDPTRTDEIAMMVYAHFQAQVDLPNSPLGTPSCLISVLSDRDSTTGTGFINAGGDVAPNGASFALPVPASVNVTGLPTVTLNFLTSSTSGGYLLLQNGERIKLEQTEGDILLEGNLEQVGTTTVEGFGWMPMSPLGNTILSQKTSKASGILQSMEYTNNASATFVITVMDLGTGTWDATEAVNVALDVTQTGFQYLENTPISYAVFPTNVPVNTTLQKLAPVFYNNINAINSGNATQQQFLVQGIYANITNSANAAQNLDNTINSQLFKAVSYPYFPAFTDIPYSAAQLASAIAYIEANKDAPFYPQDGVYLTSIPVSSNSYNNYNTLPNGNANIALTQGWIPIGVNQQGNGYIVKDITTLVSINNVQIIEFKAQHQWDVVRYMSAGIYQAWQTYSVIPGVNTGRQLNSPEFQSSFQAVVQGLVTLWGSPAYSLLQNVSAYIKQVTVVTDPNNPEDIDVSVPAQIIPGLGSANVTINLFSVYQSF